MEFQWDVLKRLMPAPYVPTLGPVHPDALTPALLSDVVQVAGTGRLLPYDKDRRWADAKDEQILVEAVVQRPGLVLIPTRSSRKALIKIYIYCDHPHGALGEAADLGKELCGYYGVRGRLTWFLPPHHDPDPVAACIRIQMMTFDPGQPAPGIGPAPVIPLGEADGPVQATFHTFAEKLATEGFDFLYSRMRDAGTGPVLTCVRDQQVVGAIGPMEIMPDSLGAARLLPQYFGVLPTYRGLGLGRALWRAAMQWGHKHRAVYQLLQTVVGGASDCLCRSEGLADLGLVCSRTLF